MTSFVLDPSISFSVSCDLTLILCSKNREIKNKMKMKNKIEKNKSTICKLDNMVFRVG